MIDTQRKLGFVRSRNHTRIAYQRLGAGPPIVVVHGGLASSRSWFAVARRLADRFEWFLLDRRGRGDSDDGTQPHSIEREVEDVHAVLAEAGAPAALLGHSYGGAVALELTRVAEPGAIGMLLLYEPAIRVEGLIPATHIDRMHELVSQQQPELAVALAIEQLHSAGLVESNGTPDPDAQPSPQRAALAQIAWTVPREITAVDALSNDLARYSAIDVPVLVMTGTASPDRQHRNCYALTDSLPDARLSRLHGQGHIAHNAAPDQIAGVIDSFLNDARINQPRRLRARSDS